MSRFIESIKVEDLKIDLLELHQKRVNDTFSYFGKEGSLDLENIYKKLELDEEGLFKLRIVYDLDQNYTTQLVPYAISEIEDFKLVENDQYDYAFKFEDRKEIEQMKAKAKSEDIIIVKNNHITDASFANLLFLKNKEWFTPSTFLLNGVQRQFLLKTNKIKEAVITTQNLKDYTHFQIINAMNTIDNDFIYPIERIINLPQNSDFMEL